MACHNGNINPFGGNRDAQEGTSEYVGHPQRHKRGEERAAWKRG